MKASAEWKAQSTAGLQQGGGFIAQAPVAVLHVKDFDTGIDQLVFKVDVPAKCSKSFSTGNVTIHVDYIDTTLE